MLFLGVLVFLCTACFVLSDGRLRLVSEHIRPYHPSFLYAYLALLLQGGIVQVRRKQLVLWNSTYSYVLRTLTTK